MKINIENNEYRISQWLAEFSDPGTEQTYQESVQRRTTRQLRIALMVWAVLLILFALPDYNILGASRPFYYLLAYRIIIVTALLILFFVITPATSIFKISYPVTLVIIAAFTGFMLLFIYRSDITDVIMGVIAVEIIGLLMFIPIRFIFTFYTAIYAVVITLVTRYLLGAPTVRLINYIVLFFLPVVVGSVVAIRFGILQRKQFVLFARQKRAAEDLLKSEKSLADAQARAHLGSWEFNYRTNKVIWSDEMYRVFGVNPEDGPYTDLDRFHKAIHPDDLEIVLNNESNILTGPNLFKNEYRIIRHNDGAVRWLESFFESIYNEKGKLIRIVGTAHDITERKMAEEQIKNLLKEKELILKEVHHRVKNNMSVMMSLLSLQANSIEEPIAKTALLSASSRLQSMGVLYDKLYRSERFDEMPVKDYLSPLIDEIMAIFSDTSKIVIEKNIDDIRLQDKVLVSLGILTNEILTNSIKHAFAGLDRREIIVSFSVKNNHATYIIQDNGIGIPESVDLQNTSGLGLQLINMLAEQIMGKIQIDRKNGTKFILEFGI